MAKRRKKKSNNTFFRVLLVVLFLCYGFYLNQLDGTYSSDKTIDTFTEKVYYSNIKFMEVTLWLLKIKENS